MTNGNEFGRRRTAQKAAPVSAAPTAPGVKDEPDGSVVDTLFTSPLVGQLAGIIGGVVIVCLLITLYVTGMKGMGRALNASWEKKATSIVLDEPDPAATFGRGPCNVQSGSAEFRKLQREFGC